jgi:hypothetical protein
MGEIKNIKDFFAMYVDGFKNLTWGKTLWIIILLKLFFMFAILKVFLFPNILNSRFDTKDEKSEHVSKELTKDYINY